MGSKENIKNDLCRGEWQMVVWFNNIKKTEREPGLGRKDYKLVFEPIE